MSNNGVIVSSWVKIERECEIQVNVCHGEAEFSIGGGWANDVQMVATQEGLQCLVDATTKALATMREQAADD
ncbi:hypothetical protein [Actinokineospora sp.]|uniref:hypothetical protein n=1 Tax=Actinokineospora sp. TaxID=1872133 RepID=UPI004037663D